MRDTFIQFLSDLEQVRKNLNNGFTEAAKKQLTILHVKLETEFTKISEIDSEAPLHKLKARLCSGTEATPPVLSEDELTKAVRKEALGTVNPDHEHEVWPTWPRELPTHID